MAVLVSGVGYIGSALVERLLARGERVVGLESSYCTGRGQLEPLAAWPGFTLVEGDVADPAAVAGACACAAADGTPLTVFHLAAQPSAAVAARDPATTERANLVGARVLLEAARERGARVVFGGSFRVYGDELAGRVVDETTPYGRVGDLSHLSKIYVEQLGRMLGLPFVSVRLGVVYGRAPVMKTDPPFMTVGNLFCWKAARGEPLQVREARPVALIHVADAVEALLAAPSLLDGATWEVANAVAEVASVAEVARTVQQLARARGLAVRVEGDHAAAEAPGFVVRSRLEAVGFQPRRQLAEGLAEVLDGFLGRPR